MRTSDSAVSQSSNSEPLVAEVRFQPTGKLYHFDASGFRDLRSGDFVLVETVRGQQLGEVVNVRPPYEDEVRRRFKPIQRRATGHDLALRQHWREKGEEALAVAHRAVKRMDLPIKIVTAEYTFDGQRLTILYVSEERRDLDDLQRYLQRELDIRVSLRRIGPRDQAKLMAGYGACGELRCCSRFMADFRPISIKMAKTQGVSLNPAEITGMCGRLRCCLAYEHEQYKEACKALPRRKKYVRTPYGEGKVVDLLPLKGMVVIRIDDRRLEVPNEEVELVSK